METNEDVKRSLIQAVILAGGKGTRLAERLGGRPKPLIDVDGVPLLERQILFLKRRGIEDVVILVNHGADQIASYCAARDNFGITLTQIDDGEPRGTAGAVLACLDRLADRFLVVYGDTLFNIDIDRLLAAHVRTGAVATLFLHPNDHPFDSDLVETADNGDIVEFLPSPHPPDAFLPNLVNAGFYVLEKTALSPWCAFPVPADFGKDLFPAMLKNGARLNGYNSFEYIKDLGTPRRLDKVTAQMRSGIVDRASLMLPQACVFVDRDGTLNELRDYVRTPADLVLLPGVQQAIKCLNDAEFRVAIVTNQPVIARGECTFYGMRQIHAKLETQLGEVGAFIDRIYLCPHHPDGGFAGEVTSLKIACECRKPKTGMIRDGIRDLHVDLSRSWVVGDATSDLLAAHEAGIRSILVCTGEGGRDGKYAAVPDFVLPDFGAAVTFIVDQYPRLVECLDTLIRAVRPGDFLCIGGPARTGKSTLAATLAHELRRRGLDAIVIGLDRWIRPEVERLSDCGVEGRYDLDVAIGSLRDWLQGRAVEIDFPFYDRVHRVKRAGGSATIRADSIVLLEGVPALISAVITSRRTHRIHVGADEPRRRHRVIVDLIHRGLANANEAQRIYTSRQRDETALVEKAGHKADRVFSLDDIFMIPLKAKPQ